MVRRILGRQMGRSRSDDWEDAPLPVKDAPLGALEQGPQRVTPEGIPSGCDQDPRGPRIGQIVELISEQREDQVDSCAQVTQLAIDGSATEILELVASLYGLVYLGITVARMPGCTLAEVGARYGHTAGWASRMSRFLKHKLRSEFALFESDF